MDSLMMLVTSSATKAACTFIKHTVGLMLQVTCAAPEEMQSAPAPRALGPPPVLHQPLMLG